MLGKNTRGPQSALRAAERIERALDRPLRLGALEIVQRASIGVACSIDGGDTADELVARADAAMYRVKRLHRQQRSPGGGIAAR